MPAVAPPPPEPARLAVAAQAALSRLEAGDFLEVRDRGWQTGGSGW